MDDNKAFYHLEFKLKFITGCYETIERPLRFDTIYNWALKMHSVGGQDVNWNDIPPINFFHCNSDEVIATRKEQLNKWFAGLSAHMKGRFVKDIFFTTQDTPYRISPKEAEVMVTLLFGHGYDGDTELNECQPRRAHDFDAEANSSSFLQSEELIDQCIRENLPLKVDEPPYALCDPSERDWRINPRWAKKKQNPTNCENPDCDEAFSWLRHRHCCDWCNSQYCYACAPKHDYEQYDKRRMCGHCKKSLVSSRKLHAHPRVQAITDDEDGSPAINLTTFAEPASPVQ